MFDEYRIDVYLTDGYDDADQPRVLIDLTEAGNREQARRHVLDAVAQFTRRAPETELTAYWVGYATAMFDCTDPAQPMFLDAFDNGRELAIAIRPL